MRSIFCHFRFTILENSGRNGSHRMDTFPGTVLLGFNSP